MFRELFSITISNVRLRNSIFLFCFLCFFSACGGGTGNTPGGTPSSTSSAPTPASNQEQTGTTVASAAPTAQPTQPLVPQGSIWVTGHLFINGSDTKAGCEIRFKNIPTIQIWRKAPDQEWKLDHELGKPDPAVDDPETITYYQCGKFTTSFGFWGPRENPCLNNDQIKFVGIYKESNLKTYQGESKVYSCSDRENPPEILIILEAIAQPMMLAPHNRGFFTN